MLRFIAIPFVLFIAACDVSNDSCHILCSDASLGASSTSRFCTTESTAETCEADATSFCDDAELPLADFEFATNCGCGDEEECRPELTAQ